MSDVNSFLSRSAVQVGGNNAGDGRAPDSSQPVSADALAIDSTSAFLNRLSDDYFVAICAEPGLGQEGLITCALNESARLGARVIRCDFRLRDSEYASKAIVRTARRACGYSGPVAVGFDNVPPADESAARREARALRRMRQSGISVVLTLVPEASQLLELLPECGVLYSRDLLLPGVLSLERASRSYRLKEMTWGIPTLARSLAASLRAGVLTAAAPSAYYEALSTIVAGCLRPSLSDGELRLRLAMLLLGSGSVDDLRHVIGGSPDELLEGLRAHVPIFEVSPRLDVFRCLPGSEGESFDAVASQLSPLCGMFPEICPACIGVLVRRGEYRRAAKLFSMPQAGAALSLVISSLAEFLDVGERGLAERAVDALVPLGALSHQAACVAGAGIWALGGGGAAAESLTREALDRCRSDDRWREVLLLAECRGLLRGQPALVEFRDTDWTGLGRRLLAHREACDLLVRGRVSSAMRILVANPSPGEASCVSGALLVLDLEAARLLLGEAPVVEGADVRSSLALLSGTECDGLRGYADCLALLEMATGRVEGDDAALEAVVSRAERSGEVLVQSAALLVGCVLDLRGGAYVRAGVRATLAGAVAAGAGLAYLSRVAALLGCVSRFLLGEEVAPRDDWWRQDDLGTVCQVIGDALVSEEDFAACGAARAQRVPRDALWLLLLVERVGPLARRLGEVTPEAWSKQLAAMRANWASGAASLPEGEPSSASADGGRPPITLQLLGGFSMTVRGVRILDSRLEHRSAKSMLEYLALREGSSAKRYELVDQVWPDCDYSSGFNKAYQATSTVRSAVAEIDRDLDPFLIGRSTKTVALDRGLVACDVDEFRRCAREAADGTDDERVLRMARAAERIYAGDLFLPEVDATGYVTLVRDELRGLYADAMVAGADAALRLGRDRTAVRLATNAIAKDDLREDAIIALVRALRASGRNVEADQQYRRYARRLIQTANRPPSKLLRRAVGEPDASTGTPEIAEAAMA